MLSPSNHIPCCDTKHNGNEACPYGAFRTRVDHLGEIVPLCDYRDHSDDKLGGSVLYIERHDAAGERRFRFVRSGDILVVAWLGLVDDPVPTAAAGVRHAGRRYDRSQLWTL